MKILVGPHTIVSVLSQDILFSRNTAPNQLCITFDIGFSVQQFNLFQGTFGGDPCTCKLNVYINLG